MGSMMFNEIRAKFINYWIKKGYTKLSAAHLIPSREIDYLENFNYYEFSRTFRPSIGTVFITKYLDKIPKFIIPQISYRHNDIEDLINGDRFHLPLFQMCCAVRRQENKKKDERSDIFCDIIDFLTLKLGMDKTKFWFTYFSGGEISGRFLKQTAKGLKNVCVEKFYLSEDKEAKNILLSLNIPEEHIIGYPDERGFVGTAGNDLIAGYRIDLYYDLGEEYSCKPKESCIVGHDFREDLHIANPKHFSKNSCVRFLEIGTLLYEFLYKKKKGDKYAYTKCNKNEYNSWYGGGLGMERVAMVVQNSKSLYDSLPFKELLKLVKGEKDSKKSIFLELLKAYLTLYSAGAKPTSKNARNKQFRELEYKLINTIQKFQITFDDKKIINNMILFLNKYYEIEFEESILNELEKISETWRSKYIGEIDKQKKGLK